MKTKSSDNVPVVLSKKIEAPSLPSDVLLRTRLTNRITDSSKLALTVIQAPAGCGKTCLVSLWANKSPHETAWITLDEEDSSIDRFLLYLISSLARKGVPAEWLMQEVGHVVDRSTALTFLDKLIAALENYEKRIVVILENYHFIQTDSLVNNTASYFIQNLPSNTHIIMTSRAPVQFGLSKLRLQGLLGEITEQDLHFTVEEVEDYFFKIGRRFDKDEIERLWRQTNGWPVAIKLVALTEDPSSDPTQPHAYAQMQSMVKDYFFEEVVDHLPDQVRSFLECTTCLKSFTVPLVQYVTGKVEHEIASCIAYMEDYSLFLTSTHEKDEDTWYRFQPLFAETVLNRMVLQYPELIASIQKKAIEWYVENDFLDEAISIAADLQEYDFIRDLIMEHWNDLCANDRYMNLMRWYNHLPTSYILSDQKLCAIEALPLTTTGQIDIAIKRIDLVEKNIDPDDELFYGFVMAIKSITLAYTDQEEETYFAAKEALRLLPEDEYYLRGLNYQIYAGAVAISSPEEAIELFSKQLEDLSETNKYLNLITSARSSICIYYATLGQFDESLAWSRRAMAPYELSAHPLHSMLVNCYQAKALVFYKQGDMKQARRCIDYSTDHAFDCWSPQNVAQTKMLKAHLQYFAHDYDSSITEVKESIYLSNFGVARSFPALPALSFWISKGIINKEHFYEPQSLEYSDCFVWMRGAIDYLRKDYSVLDDLLLHRKNIPKQRLLAATYFDLLIALMYEAKDNSKSADEYLLSALSIAQNNRAHQIFIDNAPYLFDLISRVATSESSFASKILKLLPSKKVIDKAEKNTTKLTSREKEILGLIASGLSTKEIAERLFLSSETVKKHIANSYSKLGVHTRVQAIARLKEQGIL